MFLKLPPPKPTIKKRDGSSYSQLNNMGNRSKNTTKTLCFFLTVSKASYNNSAGVCFSPESLVLMQDGSLKRCDEIRAGDIVHSGAVVKCVVQTMCPTQQQALVRLSETMRATPWHPVYLNGKWTFPIHEGKVKNEGCTATWNFVLSDRHEMVIGGLRCATLGHGIVNVPGDIRSSVYWGRDVVKDLSEMPGFDKGFVTIARPEIKRSAETQLVVKLVDVANN